MAELWLFKVPSLNLLLPVQSSSCSVPEEEHRRRRQQQINKPVKKAGILADCKLASFEEMVERRTMDKLLATVDNLEHLLPPIHPALLSEQTVQGFIPTKSLYPVQCVGKTKERMYVFRSKSLMKQMCSNQNLSCKNYRDPQRSSTAGHSRHGC